MRLGKQTLRKLVREELSKVNEGIEPQIKKIAQLTGTRPDAVEDFVSKHALNFTKLLKFLQKGKLKDRMDFMTAVSGKPGNPIQKKMIKMFTESVVNERKPSKIVWDTKKISAAKRINVRKWYMKTYPSDELGGEINQKLTLWDFYNALSQNRDIYKVIGVGDSVVRERIFEKLSKVLGVAYDTIYNMWESINEAVLYGRDGEFGKDKKTWLAANYVYDKSRKGAFFGELINYLNRQGFNLNKSSLYTITRKLYQTKDYTIVDNRDWKKSKIYHKSYAPKTEVYRDKSVNESSNMGHYERVGNQTLVDSNFVNFSQGVLPNSKLVHLGMGDFALKTPKGDITFERSGKLGNGIGADFVGRPHRITDDKGGKLVDELIKGMVKKKRAVLSMSESKNIKKKGMRTVTKKQWDRTHNDYKGMIKGQPYMMWFDKKTQSTVYGPVQIKESVNEDTKKRFDVDFYKGNGDRQTSHEEIIRGDKFSDVVSQATKVAKSKGMNYVEFYHRDSFIGSIDKRNGYQFKKGRNYQKSPLPVNEGSIKKSFKVKMYGPKMRTKSSDDVVQMIAKKLKIDRGNSAKDSDKFDEIERQVEKQYDANKREINFKINLKESVVNEGRAFINAAKKAKAEGKTEFEFNGKTYPVTIKEVLRKIE